MKAADDSRIPFRAARPAAAAVALLVAGLLTGCSSGLESTSPASAPSASPASAVSSTPASSPSGSAGPLTCDDLVSDQDIVQAVAARQSADDWTVVPMSSAAGLVTGAKAVEGAGGLSCTWSAGPPNSEATTATLTVTVLPDAAKQWTGSLYGDAPTSDRRTFAGVSAAATCGDPGCGATAAIGSSWVRVDLITGSREGGPSAFAKLTDDQVFEGLTPAVESAFRAVQDATAAQLGFPDHLPADGEPAGCRNYLTKAALASALGVKDVKVATDFQPDPQLDSLFAAAELRIGDSVCHLEVANASVPTELATVTVAPEQAWAVDDIAAHPEQRGDLRPVQLQNQVDGERALSDCGSEGNQCTVVFTLSTTAIQVQNTDKAREVAEAIIAEAR